MIYLDTSPLVSLFIRDAHSARIRGLLRAGLSAIHVSSFGMAEFAAAVGVRVRVGTLTGEQATELLVFFDAWIAGNATTVDVVPADHRVAASFVRRFDLGLRAPDAVHLATCLRLRTTLLTFDRRQHAAAATLGITLDPELPPPG